MGSLFRAISLVVIGFGAFAPLLSSGQTTAQPQPYQAVPNLWRPDYHSLGFAAFSPDGKRVISIDHSPPVLWDVANGMMLRTFDDHGWRSPSGSVAFSPDGKRVIAGARDASGDGGDRDHVFKMWDTATGRLMANFKGHSGPVNSIAISSNGSRVLSGSADKTAKMWDAASGKLLRTFAGHQGTVIEVAFSPDGTRVLSLSDDKTAQLWDTATGARLLTFASPNNHFWRSGTFLPDGNRILLSSDRVTLWDASSGQLLSTFEPDPPAKLGHVLYVHWAVPSPDGRRIVAHVRLLNESDPGYAFCRTRGFPLCPGELDTLLVWETASGKQIFNFEKEAYYALLTPDGAHFLMPDGNVELRETLTGKLVRSYSKKPEGQPYHLALSPDGKSALTEGSDRAVRAWDISTGRLLRRFTGVPDDQPVDSVAFSGDGARVMASYSVQSSYPGHDGKGLIVWDAATGQKIYDIPDVAVPKVSPDGKSFLVFGANLELRDFATGKLVHEFASKKRAAFSPDSSRIVTGAANGTQFWDAKTGELIGEFDTGDAETAVSTDGNRLLSGRHDAIQLWDVATGRPLLNIKPTWPPNNYNTAPSSVQFSPDGAVLCATSSAWTKIWDANTGRLMREFKDGAGPDAFSPDGRRILINDTVWDVATGRPVRQMPAGHGVASPDWTRFLSIGGKLTVSKMETGEILATLLDTNEGEWVAYTPEGFFDGSKDATNLFNIIRGSDIVDRNRVEKVLHQPDMLHEKLAGDPDGKVKAAVKSITFN
jgi:WD40 repeat protein